MKRTPFKRKPKRAKRKRREIESKGYKPPGWFTSLPLGSHGLTPAQKKYWKVTSDFVRKRDFDMYGRCVSCDKHIEDWRETDCGHYKAWAVCNGFFKYDLKNLAMQCKSCNKRSDGPVGTGFGEELQRRYGEEHLLWIAQENLKHKGEKMEVWQIVERTELLLNQMQ